MRRIDSVSPYFLHGLFAGVLLILLFVSGIAGLSIYRGKVVQQQRALAQTENLSRLLERNIDNIIDKADLALRTIDREAERELERGAIDDRGLNELLAYQQSLLPDVLTLGIADADGRVRLRGDRTAIVANVADREYFLKAKSDTADHLLVAGPVLSRIDNKWVLVLARRISRPDGSFAGVAYASVASEHFIKLFSEMDLGRYGAISLRTSDLVLVARYPNQDGSASGIGTNKVSIQLKEAMAQDPNVGAYIAATALDGIERANSYRRIAAYPLHVIVGIATEDYLAGWRRDAIQILALVALVIVVALLSCWLLYRYWKAQRLAAAALARETEHFQMLLRTASDGIHVVDAKGFVLEVSDAFCAMLGYSRDELLRMNLGQWNADLPADLARLKDGQDRRWVFTTRLRHKSGRLVDAEIAAHALELDGKPVLFCSAREIGERLAAEAALRRSEAKFSAMLRLTPEPVALTRLDDGVILEASRSYASYFGYEVEEMIGRSTRSDDLGIWCDTEDRQRWQEALSSQDETIGFETPLRRRDGSVAIVRISSKVIDLEGERLAITSLHDISAQKHQEEHLRQIAHHDPLTRLPNRLLLGDRLRQAIAQNHRAGTRVAVCYLDLDGFKEVNDELGHDAGDAILVEVANRLSAAVREGDTVARLGGDEFVILLSALSNDEECRIALGRILGAVSAPYQRDRRTVDISASIGVTVYPTDSADPDTLVRHADHAMYVAKQAGKNRYQLFDTKLEGRIEARLAAMQRVAAGLEAGQLRLYYQPKVDCRKGVVVGAEALLRWQHPVLGTLTPAEFLPLIEDTDLAIAVGDWVFREALRHLAEWQRQGIRPRVSVNAFVRQLLEPGFVDALGGMLAEFPDLGPQSLIIEIVETAALKELDVIRRVMEECRELGLGFSLDDFGTGYSTLAYIRHLPAQEIKIDQSFVRNMLINAEDLTIVDAVIGLSRAFRRTVTAEGAETADHIVRLLELGCDVMQGYAIARPMPADDLPAWIGTFRPDPAWFGRPSGIAEVEGNHAAHID